MAKKLRCDVKAQVKFGKEWVNQNIDSQRDLDSIQKLAKNNPKKFRIKFSRCK